MERANAIDTLITFNCSLNPGEELEERIRRIRNRIGAGSGNFLLKASKKINGDSVFECTVALKGMPCDVQEDTRRQIGEFRCTDIVFQAVNPNT